MLELMDLIKSLLVLNSVHVKVVPKSSGSNEFSLIDITDNPCFNGVMKVSETATVNEIKVSININCPDTDTKLAFEHVFNMTHYNSAEEFVNEVINILYDMAAETVAYD